MFEWDRVRAQLGATHSRVVYIEQRLGRLIEQSDDFKAEIESLKSIAADVRPVMSPDKSFELVMNETTLIAQRILPSDIEDVKAACPLRETLNWVLNKVAGDVYHDDGFGQSIDDAVTIIEHGTMNEAEQKAQEILKRQIEQLKIEAQKQMELLEGDVYKPSLSNLRTLKTWLQSKVAKTSPNRRVVSPQVNASRISPPKRGNQLPELIRVPTGKEKVTRSELINPAGDGKFIHKTVKSNLVANK